MCLGKPLTSQGDSVAILADRGWQSSGFHLTAGKSYRISSEGQFVVRKGNPAWESEANGITIEYANGRPLGMLLGSVRRDEPEPGVSSLNAPFTIGMERVLKPNTTGTLYLRVNDLVSGYGDNDGEVTVRVQPIEGRKDK